MRRRSRRAPPGGTRFSPKSSNVRRSLSIPWNIAEGAGRFGAPDGARFYSIARGSRWSARRSWMPLRSCNSPWKTLGDRPWSC
ncbi:MAG: four helix bundle protein [Myxococcales bacterium]|nr:four helix bundle protein [Myxococcales bacterium]